MEATVNDKREMQDTNSLARLCCDTPFIQFLGNAICRASAEAIDGYLHRTKCNINDIPEQYISSFVAERLGFLMPAMIEVSTNRLIELCDLAADNDYTVLGESFSYRSVS